MSDQRFPAMNKAYRNYLATGAASGVQGSDVCRLAIHGNKEDGVEDEYDRGACSPQPSLPALTSHVMYTVARARGGEGQPSDFTLCPMSPPGASSAAAQAQLRHHIPRWDIITDDSINR